MPSGNPIVGEEPVCDDRTIDNLRRWERNVMLERLLVKTEQLFDVLIKDIIEERSKR